MDRAVAGSPNGAPSEGVRRSDVDLGALEADLAQARAAADGARVAAVHLAAADRLEAAGAREAACFELVAAYVYALEAGAAVAETARARLVALGREA